MARETNIYSRSRIAAADLSSSQFCAVTLNSSGQAALPSAGGRVLGIVQNKPSSGQIAEVRVLGTSKMLVGPAGVTAGDAIMVDTSGRAVTATSTNYVIGYAEDTAAGATLVTVTLLPSGKL